MKRDKLVELLDKEDMTKEEEKELRDIMKEETEMALRDKSSYIKWRAAMFSLGAKRYIDYDFAKELAEAVLPYVKKSKIAAEMYIKISKYLNLHDKKILEENYL